MTPQQLAELRDQLPPFGEAISSSALLDDYCRFYQLDFAQRQTNLQYTAGVVLSGVYKLAVQSWQQPEATSNLLLVHGYFDHTGLFDKLIEWGLSRHCNVLIFDLPGHGLSSGDPAVIDDFGDYSTAIADVLATANMPSLPLWVMAQSTGGAALIDFAGKYEWPFAATVLLAPLVRPAGWNSVQMAYLVLNRLVNSVPRKFVVNSSDGEFLAFLQSDPLQCRQVSLRWVGALRRWLAALRQRDLGVGPALVIQGDADTTVDWRYNIGVVTSLFPDSQIEYLAGAGHQLANESTMFRTDYLGSVAAYLAANSIALGKISAVQAS